MMDGPKFAQLRAYAIPAGNTTPLYSNGRMKIAVLIQTGKVCIINLP